MELILEYVKRRLREIGPPRWEAIAEACGIAKTLPRKIAYCDRENPGVMTVQPLVTYLQAIDRGEIALPAPRPRAEPTHKCDELVVPSCDA